MNKDTLQLILVAGPSASGKRTFASCYKNAFLQSLKIKDLKIGIKEEQSFAALTELSDGDLELISKAYKKGYRITIYFLFTGRQLTCLRGRYRQISEGIPFDEAEARKEYDHAYKGLEDIAHRADLVFLIKNQKEFNFLAALEPKTISTDQFHKAIRTVKKSVDTIIEQ